jgi:hypothetical protein
MMNSSGRRFRPLFTLVFAGSLLLGPAITAPVHAQPPPAEGEADAGKGRSLDGYLLMVMLAAGAFFVVGKTARR